MLKKLTGLIIINLLFVIAVNAQSQQLEKNINNLSPKQDRSTTNGSPPKAGQHQDGAANQEQQSQKSPIIIKQDKSKIEDSSTQKSKNDKSEELEIQRQMAKSTKTIADFTIALVAVTAFLGLIAIWQGWIANKSADAAKKSADALQAVERAKLSIRVQPDPPRKEAITGIEAGHNQVKIIIINEGKSLATITKINWYIGIISNKGIDRKISELKSANSEYAYGSITIKEGDSKDISVMSKEITSSDLQKIDYSTTYFVCLGHIKYKDVFRRIHERPFCWKDNGTYFEPDPDPKRNYGT